MVQEAPDRKLRIAGFHNNEGFCGFYRIKYPLDALKFNGDADTHIVNVSQTEEMLELCAWADVLVFQYAAPFKLMEKIQDLILTDKLPKIIVSDFDDDLFDIDPQNPAYNTFGTEECWFEHKDDPTDKKYLRKDGEDGFDIKRNKELLEGTSKALIISDLITVSTEPLRKSFLPLNENIVVLENAIQPIEMTGSSNPNKRDFFEQTVIGWQGSDSHVHDMRVVAPVLKRVQQRYGDMVKYRFFGTRFEQLYEGLDFEVIPWIKPHLFYDRFSHNLFDIGIIPLENTRFNRCKSNIKFLEYSYYGIPSVVADVTPYKETVKHNVTGLKYRDPEQMFQNICKLVEDRLLRKKLAETAKKHVIANYNVNQKAIQWKRVYEQALKDKKLALGLS